LIILIYFWVRREHRDEIEKLSEKSKFDKNIADLIKRSDQLDAAQEEIGKLKSDLKESVISKRMVVTDLEETVRIHLN